MRAAQIAASVANLRDLGELSTLSGQVVARGRVYRSSHFAALAPEDGAAVAALGLRTVIDLRGVDERAAAMRRQPWPGEAVANDLHLPIEPSALAAMRDLRARGTPDELAFVHVMHGVYGRFVERHTAVYAALLKRLLDAANYPVAFHCTAGKDRTGFAAAIVLLALGVARDDIVDDFLLSNQRWQSHDDSGDWTVLSRVRADYLQTAFKKMDAGWGSSDAYLEQALGFGASQRAQLAALLLRR